MSDHPALLGVAVPPPPSSPGRVCGCGEWCMKVPTRDVWIDADVSGGGYWVAVYPGHEAALFGEESESDDREQDGGDQEAANQDG